VYTEDEPGVARRNLLFVLLRRVILRCALLGRAAPGRNKTNKKLHLATLARPQCWYAFTPSPGLGV